MIKIYEKNKKYYKNVPIIKEKINKNKKLAKVLRKIIDEIIKNKIRKNTNIGNNKIINLSWINDPKPFNQINQDVTDKYKNDKKSPELLPIQSFLDEINNEYIKNKKDAFKKMMLKVKI